jgi:hypothetical protein
MLSEKSIVSPDPLRNSNVLLRSPTVPLDEADSAERGYISLEVHASLESPIAATTKRIEETRTQVRHWARRLGAADADRACIPNRGANLPPGTEMLNRHRLAAHGPVVDAGKGDDVLGCGVMGSAGAQSDGRVVVGDAAAPFLDAAGVEDGGVVGDGEVEQNGIGHGESGEGDGSQRKS